jgi:hypothetical protein
VISVGMCVAVGTGLNEVIAGVDDAGEGLNDWSGMLDELVQAASSTLARMLGTITNTPEIRRCESRRPWNNRLGTSAAPS